MLLYGRGGEEGVVVLWNIQYSSVLFSPHPPSNPSRDYKPHFPEWECDIVYSDVSSLYNALLLRMWVPALCQIQLVTSESFSRRD